MAKKKFEIMMQRCKGCGYWHATFWKSTPPPSCAERQKLNASRG